MSLRRTLFRITGTAMCFFWLLSCRGPHAGISEPENITVLSLAPEPTLQIGVVEGATELELHETVSSMWLRNDRIVVANAGSGELLFFDMSGQFLSKSGRRGGGPGEFQALSRVYASGPDSILALDKIGDRVSVLDTRGNFGRVTAAETISGDSVFPMDVWLHRRFWVEGALRPSRRRAVRQMLDSMPLPEAEPAYRYVQVDAGGNAWIREPLGVDSEAWHWTVVDSTGKPVAAIQTPLRFEPHHIGVDFVLGRWFGENDVNFIRLYRMAHTDTTASPPEWTSASAHAAGHMQITSEEEDRLLNSLRSSLRNVVTAQEQYYAGHGTYSQSRHNLELDLPEGFSVDIILAHSRGWSAVAMHADLPRICGMAVGMPTPPGWIEGVARCG